MTRSPTVVAVLVLAEEGLARQLYEAVLLALPAVEWRIAERPIAGRRIVAGILIAERRSEPQQSEPPQPEPPLTATTVVVTTTTAATKTPTAIGSASNISVGRDVQD